MTTRRPSPHAWLKSVETPAHGGLDYAELDALGLKADDIVDFSANLNPRGAPPEVQAAIDRVIISRYPDSEAAAFRRRLGSVLGLPAEQIIAGNGSSEIIWMIAMAFIESGDRVVVAGPTFGEYERAAKLAGGELLLYKSLASEWFKPSVADLGGLLTRWQPKVAFLCNPNNPTGVYLDRESVEWIARRCEDTLLVLDEAYVGFVEDAWPSLGLLSKNVLVLRSLTKDYGLAGLRLGYGLATESTIAVLRKVRPPWNVNAMAQAAGCACVDNETWVAESRHEMMAAKDYLVSAMLGHGFPVIPSAATFFLSNVGDARSFRGALLQQGLLVRDCASFGLPEFVRVSARSKPDSTRLALAAGRLRRTGQ